MNHEEDVSVEMDILEILSARQVDIYISLFMTLLGLLLGLILDAVRHRKHHHACQEHETIVSVTVANFINPRLACKSRHSKDEGLLLLIALAASIFGGVYLFMRVEVLQLLYYFTIFIISLWSGGVLHSLMKGRYAGWHWLANMAFYVASFVFLFMVVEKAITPNYAPTYFQYSQQIVHQYGIAGLGDYFSALDLRWFMLHLFGVFLLFMAMFRLCLSATYFAVMGSYILSAECREPWLVRKTRKYAKLWENVFFVSLTLLVAYYLIAGNVFMWIEYGMLDGVEGFLERVWRGR